MGCRRPRLALPGVEIEDLGFPVTSVSPASYVSGRGGRRAASGVARLSQRGRGMLPVLPHGGIGFQRGRAGWRGRLLLVPACSWHCDRGSLPSGERLLVTRERLSQGLGAWRCVSALQRGEVARRCQRRFSVRPSGPATLPQSQVLLRSLLVRGAGLAGPNPSFRPVTLAPCSDVALCKTHHRLHTWRRALCSVRPGWHPTNHCQAPGYVLRPPGTCVPSDHQVSRSHCLDCFMTLSPISGPHYGNCTSGLAQRKQGLLFPSHCLASGK